MITDNCYCEVMFNTSIPVLCLKYPIHVTLLRLITEKNVNSLVK